MSKAYNLFLEKQQLRKRRVNITLTEEDFKEVQELASRRNNKEVKFGAMTYGGKRGSEEAHLIGLAAEQAVAKHTGTSVDKRIFENHGDNGLDLDEKWGVKCTTYFDDPFLRVEIEHFNDNIEAYILCCVNSRNIRDISLVGWADKDTVKLAKQKRFLPNGPLNYVLEEKDLQDMRTLKID